jgi:hypothetical protein
MGNNMKGDASLMFDPLRNGAMAGELETLGFDGVYSFEGQHDLRPQPKTVVARMAMQRCKTAVYCRSRDGEVLQQ